MRNKQNVARRKFLKGTAATAGAGVVGTAFTDRSGASDHPELEVDLLMPIITTQDQSEHTYPLNAKYNGNDPYHSCNECSYHDGNVIVVPSHQQTQNCSDSFGACKDWMPKTERYEDMRILRVPAGFSVGSTEDASDIGEIAVEVGQGDAGTPHHAEFAGVYDENGEIGDEGETYTYGDNTSVSWLFDEKGGFRIDLLFAVPQNNVYAYNTHASVGELDWTVELQDSDSTFSNDETEMTTSFPMSILAGNPDGDVSYYMQKTRDIMKITKDAVELFVFRRPPYATAFYRSYAKEGVEKIGKWAYVAATQDSPEKPEEYDSDTTAMGGFRQNEYEPDENMQDGFDEDIGISLVGPGSYMVDK
jgi:hypothetical protein